MLVSVQILDRDGTHARYVVFVNGKELYQVHRDVSEEVAEADVEGTSLHRVLEDAIARELRELTGDEVIIHPHTDSSEILSAPPSGNFRVVNLWVDPSGKMNVEYSDTPVP